MADSLLRTSLLRTGHVISALAVLLAAAAMLNAQERLERFPAIEAEAASYTAPLESFPSVGAAPAIGSTRIFDQPSPPFDEAPIVFSDGSTVTGGLPNGDVYEPVITENVYTPAPPNYFIRGLVRGYYQNDQRIEFTGLEETFGAEAAMQAALWREANGWLVQVDTELFLNQPFDRNILVDSPTRRSFANNFDIEPLQISQLYVTAKRNDFSISLGRFVTPFGRVWFPTLQNDLNDAPFIRSEVILWRETGALLQYNPGPLVVAVGAVNGGPNRDANSSKAGIARIGLNMPQYAAGVSIKKQDGIGSEGQKTTNNHIGADVMATFGRWRFSGEVIYDEYGLRRPFDPNQVTWGRSLYFREQNIGRHVPIKGAGWYANVNYDGPKWFVMLNYGEYYPQQIGVREHDQINRRGILKLIHHHSDDFDIYSTMLLENSLSQAFDGRSRIGKSITAGFQLNL